MKLPLIVLALTTSAWANPIPVSGLGYFYSAVIGGNTGFDIWFGGNLDSRSVYVFQECLGGYPGCFSQFGGFADIDGQHFGAGFFSFDLGEFGTVTGYDSALSPVATESIRGFVQITSNSCTPSYDCYGTLEVDPTPEPSTCFLTALGLFALACHRPLRALSRNGLARPWPRLAGLRAQLLIQTVLDRPARQQRHIR